MIRWLRVVWPFPGWLIVILVLHLGEVGLLFVRFSEFGRVDWREALHWLNLSPPITLSAAAVLYACYRVSIFHPAVRPGYRGWLANTPWRFPQELPFGPVHLVAQDAAILGLMMLVAFPFYQWGALLILKVFLVVYLLYLAVTFVVTEEWLAAYALAFAFGSMAYSWAKPWQFWSVTAVAYGIGMLGLRRSLRRFPWGWGDDRPVGSGGPTKFDRTPDVGWPFGRLGPETGGVQLPLGHGLVRALVLAWSAFVVLAELTETLALQHREAELHNAVPAYIVAGFLVFGRITFYDPTRYRPPISLAGRFRTGRWIIPGYDQVFVAPLLAILAVVVLPPLLIRIDSGWTAANAITIGTAALVVLTVGPSYRRWALTGEHRIAPDRSGAVGLNDVRPW
jgi:hypothetical protein